MRVLVLVCLSFLQMSVAVSSTLAAVRPLCPPTISTTLTSGAIAPPSTPGSIVFNEILDNPGAKTLWNCAAQTNSPWLELFNPQNQAYDLHASFAAIDHGQGTARFYLASGSIIAAHGFFVLFPSLSNLFIFQGQSVLFRLLLQGIPVDQVTVPALGVDQSYARMPDGGTTWQITNMPTIGISNNIATATATTTRPTPGPTATYIPHQQSTRHTTSSTPPEKQPTANSALHIAEKQPAWDGLHLPLPTPTMQPATSTLSPVATPAPAGKQNPVWPLLAGLLGLVSVIGGLLIRYKKRMKAT